jgi:hypothetical protein
MRHGLDQQPVVLGDEGGAALGVGLQQARVGALIDDGNPFSHAIPAIIPASPTSIRRSTFTRLAPAPA